MYGHHGRRHPSRNVPWGVRADILLVRGNSDRFADCKPVAPIPRTPCRDCHVPMPALGHSAGLVKSGHRNRRGRLESLGAGPQSDGIINIRGDLERRLRKEGWNRVSEGGMGKLVCPCSPANCTGKLQLAHATRTSCPGRARIPLSFCGVAYMIRSTCPCSRFPVPHAFMYVLSDLMNYILCSTHRRRPVRKSTEPSWREPLTIGAYSPSRNPNYDKDFPLAADACRRRWSPAG
jgi:hypothetical protein